MRHMLTLIPFLGTKRHMGIPSVLGLQEMVLNPVRVKIWFENPSKGVAELNREPLSELPVIKKVKSLFFLLL